MALAATFCVTGIREGEAVAFGMGSLEGTAGARRLQAVGNGHKARAIPVEGTLEKVLEGGGGGSSAIADRNSKS